MKWSVMTMLATTLFLSACGEPASTWDDQRGRFRSTQEMKEEQRERDRDIERRLDNLEKERLK